MRAAFCKELADFLDGLVSHYVLDDGKLVVAHAGMKEEMQGRGSGKVRDFALYGETTGETDEFGLPVRYDWAAEYRGQAMVVYGHTPVPEPEWLNRTVNIDTGCVFGGKLTALRYPEKEFVSVPAARTYCEPARPFLPAEQQAPALSAQQAHDEVLDAEDVLGKRIIPTRLRGNVTIREENAAAALEVMSRFAADPRWLIYLPPTMSPCETSGEPGLLEHPAEAFAYYRSQGVPQVVCEEKHMGSRAVVIVCRDEAAARERFGVDHGRTRHRLHPHRPAVLQRPGPGAAVPRPGAGGPDRRRPLGQAGDDLGLPRLRADAVVGQGPGTPADPVRGGRGGRVGLAAPSGRRALEQAAGRLDGEEQDKLVEVEARYRRREQDVGRFVAAYRQYCWPVESLTDLKLAPFHLLATEGHVHTDKDHLWHMETLAEVCRADPELLLATPYQVVDVTDPASQAAGIAWWEELTGRGGEGMVVKPLSFIHKGRPGPRPARREVPGAGVPADHLRPRLHDRGEPRPAAVPGPGPEAVAGPRRVRPGRRGAGAVRAAGAAAAGPRVRLRRAGPGERAGGPEAVTGTSDRMTSIRIGRPTYPGGPCRRNEDREGSRPLVVPGSRYGRDAEPRITSGYPKGLRRHNLDKFSECYSPDLR